MIKMEIMKLMKILNLMKKQLTKIIFMKFKIKKKNMLK